jgi:PTS system mannose-specific IIA component
MIGLILVTHAGLAAELLKAAETIVGPLCQVQCHAVGRGVDIEDFRAVLQDSIHQVNVDGDGVLIMTDIFGGTPSNVSARLLKKDHVEVINGVNLPMLIKFSSSRDTMPVGALASFLTDYGQKNIILTSEILQGVGR